MDNIAVRRSGKTDHERIAAIYPAAFPEEDLQPLVRTLLAQKTGVHSFVAEKSGDLVGHILLTQCSVAEHQAPVGLLGPLAVAPIWQRKGIGSVLVRHGVEQLQTLQMTDLFVLGDPDFYTRFGFRPTHSVAPPHPLPESWQPAWQSLNLIGDNHTLQGSLDVPAPWRDPALWAP